MTIIRAMRDSDTDVVLSLLAAQPDQAYTGQPLDGTSLLAQANAGAGATIVAQRNDGRLIGIASFILSEDNRAQLTILWVDPEFRRRGLARALIARLGFIWAQWQVHVRIPPAADAAAVLNLLTPFGFRPAPGDGTVLKARRFRRLEARSSLARM